MRTIIKDLVEFYNTRNPTESLKSSYNKLGKDLFTPISKIVSWNAESVLGILPHEKYTLNEMPIYSMSGALMKYFDILFTTCDDINKIFILDKKNEQVCFQSTLSEKEKEEIRTYIAENRKKPKLFVDKNESLLKNMEEKLPTKKEENKPFKGWDVFDGIDDPHAK